MLSRTLHPRSVRQLASFYTVPVLTAHSSMSLKWQHISRQSSTPRTLSTAQDTQSISPPPSPSSASQATVNRHDDNDDDLMDSVREMQLRTLSMFRKMCKEAHKFITFPQEAGFSPRVLRLFDGERIYGTVHEHFRKQLVINGRQLRRICDVYRLARQEAAMAQTAVLNADNEGTKNELSDANDHLAEMRLLLQDTVAAMDQQLTEYTYYLLCALNRTFRECLLHNKKNKRKTIDLSVRMHILKQFSEGTAGNDSYKRALMDTMVDLERTHWEQRKWRRVRSRLQGSEDVDNAYDDSGEWTMYDDTVDQGEDKAEEATAGAKGTQKKTKKSKKKKAADKKKKKKAGKKSAEDKTVKVKKMKLKKKKKAGY